MRRLRQNIDHTSGCLYVFIMTRKCAPKRRAAQARSTEVYDWEKMSMKMIRNVRNKSHPQVEENDNRQHLGLRTKDDSLF